MDKFRFEFCQERISAAPVCQSKFFDNFLRKKVSTNTCMDTVEVSICSMQFIFFCRYYFMYYFIEFGTS